MEKNKLIEKELCQFGVLISVYLWRRGREDGEGDTFRVASPALTVFQPTEIRTNTGSVSYPKVERKRRI